MQNSVRALFKVVDGIAEVVALGVVNVDDVIASANGQGILIGAVVVVAVDVDLFISTRDLCSEGHTGLNLLLVQNSVRALFKVVDGIAEVAALGVVNVDDILRLIGADGQGVLIDAVVVVAIDSDNFISTLDLSAYVLSPTLLVQNLVCTLLKVVDGIRRSVCRLSPSANQFNICFVDGNCIAHRVAVIRPTVEGVGEVTRVIGVTGLLHGCLLVGNIIPLILGTSCVVRCSFIKLIRHLIGFNVGFRGGNRSERFLTDFGESCLAAIGIILFRSAPVLIAGIGLDIEGHDQLIAAGVGSVSSVSYDVVLIGIVKTADRDGLSIETDSYFLSDILAIARPFTITLISNLLDRHTGDRAVLVD